MSNAPKIIISPRVVTHSVTSPSGVLETNLKGGLPRTRVDILGGYSVVPVSWVFDSKEKFDYLMAMYNSILNEGALPFQLYIPVLSSECKWVECKFVPGSFKHSNTDTILRTITATVKVIDQRDIENDAILTALINATESFDCEDHLKFLSLFENMSNVNNPDSLEDIL